MMENFTYQEKCNGEHLETYEWDNLWWEHADDIEKDRALIIGDSISCGYRGFVNKQLEGKVYADGLGTSKAVDNPKFLELIDYVISQQHNKCKMIFFNNGLHGWHLNIDDYKASYTKIVKHIINNNPDKKVYLMLSTPTRDDRVEAIKQRNIAVTEIANTEGLEIVDLYTAIYGKDEVYKDRVHLLDDGYDMLAQVVTNKILSSL